MTPPTLAEALRESCRRWGEKPALVEAAGSQARPRTLTYRQLGDAAGALAAGYRRLGVNSGERVICQLPNSASFLIAALGAWWGNVIHVGADADLAPPELTWLAGHTGAAALLTQPAMNDTDRWDATLRLLRTDHPALRVIGAGEARPEGVDAWLADLMGSDAASVEPAVTPGPEDVATILVTSGTTSQPKGVVRQHGQLLAAWTWMADALGVGSSDVHLAQLPLAHGFGFGMAIMALLTGGTLVVLERFSPSQTLRVIGEQHVTMLHGTPPHFRLLVDRLDPAAHDVSSLRIGVGSAARFPPELLEAIFDRLGMDLYLSYGSSEGLGWSTSDRAEMLAGSVGTVDPELVTIIGPDDRPVPSGEVGEIICRRVHTVRYWGVADVDDADESSEWYHTGDLGRIDGDGRLYVLGRVRHQINRGGIRIDPGEIEAALVGLPGVIDAAAVGLPDPVVGEIVCACVVAEGDGPGLDELRRALGVTLARHKLPEQACVLEMIPRTALGKVDREALQAFALASKNRQCLRDS